MTTYTITKQNEIEIDFHGVKPDYATRNKMKAVRIWWNPDKKIWHGPVNDQTLAVTKEICGEISVSVTPAPAPKRSIRKAPADDYALKVKIRDIISADKSQLESWEKQLKDHVNEVMGEDNASHSGNSVSKTQESVWMNCFRFITKNLSGLNSEQQEYELIFEYSLPGTVHERPDVFLLTDRKAISLEFKRKEAPQMTGNIRFRLLWNRDKSYMNFEGRET